MANQQAIITITGNLGADPVNFSKDVNNPAVSLRVGVTPRYYSSRSAEWKDRGTTWFGVRVYRQMAMNVLGSFHKGEPVIVTGALHTEQWEKNGVIRVTPVIEASALGHDLSSGVSTFGRVTRKTGGQQQAGSPASATGEPVPASPVSVVPVPDAAAGPSTESGPSPAEGSTESAHESAGGDPVQPQDSTQAEAFSEQGTGNDQPEF